MDNIFTYLIPIVLVLAVISIIIMIFTRKNSSSDSSGTFSSSSSSSVKSKKKNQAQIVRDANKKLSKDPHDPAGLIPIGDVYFTSHLWEKAYSVYDQLVRLASENISIDPFLVWLRLGICAIQLKKTQEGYTALTTAAKLKPQNYEVNYYLGRACFDLEQWDKAISCFKKALIENPEAEGVYFSLAQALYNSRRFKESLPCFKKALTEDPSNKEAIYDMADAMQECGMGDKAIRMFMHLRPDPVYGARSCLAAGIYHSQINDRKNAISDYEIGLKHENTPQNIRQEILYNLGRLYFEEKEISKGLNCLKQIRSINLNYKDVNALIGRYQELSQNSNLQIYLTSNSSEFVALCRQFIAVKYKDSTVKIQSIDVDPLFTDIFANVYNARWEDSILFRFFRTNGITGDMYVREFHNHMQDLKAARGYCISAGSFTEECHKYIEGRSLDLIEKNDLNKILKQIQMR